MAEHRGIRSSHPTNYGTMGQPYDSNYKTNPDVFPGFTNYAAGNLSSSAAMNPAMNVPYNAPSAGAAFTVPATATDGPTAPPCDWPNIPGYEGTGIAGDGGKFLPPPDFGPIPGAATTPATNNWMVPSISEDDARIALLEYAKSKCCYSANPAKEMIFQELRPFNTYRYRLETFTESRACAWVNKPYTGQAVDSPTFGPAPQPWEIPVQITAMFQDTKTKMPVPHTSSLKTCPQCMGTCKRVCDKCHGTRRVKCWVCNGSGRNMNDTCHHCRGQGTEGCTTCHSTGYKTCLGCSGQGKILNYIELTVTWKNNIYEFVADHNSEFPTGLFKKVNGEKMFTDEQMFLSPLVNFPAPAINQASQNALQQHHSQFSSSSRILRQRHTIEWLPLTKVGYIWKEKRYDYFVYGSERKVYTDNYPQKCCCVIM